MGLDQNSGAAPQRMWARALGVLRIDDTAPGRLALLFCLPLIIFLLAIIAYPTLYALYLSLHRLGATQIRTGVLEFVGIKNFLNLFRDELFHTSLKNTLVFATVSVIMQVVLALLIALGINMKFSHLSRVSHLLVLLPFSIPPVVNALMWSFILHSKFGYANIVLYNLGLIQEFVSWLGNPKIALFSVAIPYIWRTTPFSVLLFHAALQGIPEELHEAAMIDGASVWTRFWKITLPLLRPVLTVVLILRTTWAFIVFDEILAMTQGGPGDSTWTAGWYTYHTSFYPPIEMGIGAASAYVLTLMIGVLAYIYVRVVYRRIEY
jgi:multiple sugar transport system permease protein